MYGMAEHQWKTDADHEVDYFAYEVEGDGQGHNGPACTQCKLTFCMHCAPGGWEIPCPGPAPEGDRWNWMRDSAGHPPSTPKLWSAA